MCVCVCVHVCVCVCVHVCHVCVCVMCQDLNCHLSGRVFLTGYKLSLADILLYYGLHRYMVSSVCIIYKVDTDSLVLYIYTL